MGRPKHPEFGEGPSDYFSSDEELFNVKNFEAFYLTVSYIKERSDQPGYQTYHKLDKLLLNVANNCNFDSNFLHYGKSFDPPMFRTQLEILSTTLETPIYFLTLKKKCFGELCNVLSEVV